MKIHQAMLTGFATVFLSVTVAAQKPLNVPLKWLPDETPEVSLDLTGGVRAVRVEPIVDMRDKGKSIGENPEKKPPVPIVTDSNVAAFVTDNVIALLKRFGVEVVADARASRVLRLELLEFWVTDSDLYRATSRFRVRMTDENGAEIWTAVLGGSSDNFGRSLRAVNFQETLSNAVQAFVVNLLKAEAFQKALKKSFVG